jgi:hypothetical protein
MLNGEAGGTTSLLSGEPTIWEADVSLNMVHDLL